MRDCGMVLLASAFFRQTTPETTFVLAKFLAWFLFWDEELDCGKLQFDTAGTNLYREKTLAYLKHCLEPDLYGPPPSSLTGHNSGVFKDIGEALQTGQSDRK
jgi:hypothetical protein